MAVVFYYFAKINNCIYLLEKQIRKLGPQYTEIGTLLYFINEVNTLCRPCAKYEQLKNDYFRVLFLVKKDYSDHDIENFAHSFKILPHHEIQRMTDAWEHVYKVCNSNRRGINYNFLIIIDDKGKIIEIRRF